MADIAERIAAIDWSGLAQRLDGAVLHAGEKSRLLVGKQYCAGKPLPFPKILLQCQNVDDVYASLELLRSEQIPFSVRSAGHCFADLSSSEHVVLGLAELKQITVQGELVQTGPGNTLADISRHLLPLGRVLVTGAYPRVGIGGSSLSGGIGHLGRRHGLTVDQIERLQVVIADGRVVQTDAETEPDLFWALRGGGTAGFGVVTALTLRTQPLQTMTVCRGAWRLDQAPGLIERWQHLAPVAHEDINIQLGVGSSGFPDEPDFIELFGIVLGATETATDHFQLVAELLGPLAKQLKIWTLAGAAAAGYLVGLLNHQTKPSSQVTFPYPEAGYQYTRCDFFEETLSAEAIGNCLDCFRADRRDRVTQELVMAPWGGTYHRPNPAACFFHRAPRMLIRHTAMLGARATPELREHGRQWVDASQATLSRHANGHAYQGYADLRLDDWAHAYYGETYPRLQQIKRRYDPNQVFRHAQSIEPSG